MCRTLLLSIAFAIVSGTSGAQVIINEFMASNGSILSDENGQFSDWIELYNSGPGEVNLEGYFLSDDFSDPTKWIIPAGVSLEPTGYLLLWADGRNTGLHTSFSLNSQKEEIALFDPDTLLVDSVRFYDQVYNYSFGRSESEPGSWGFFLEPSPGSANQGDFVTGRCKAPVLDLAPGMYSQAQRIPVINKEPGAFVYYTLDGSIPSEESSPAGERISAFGTLVIRTRAFKAGMLPSKVVTQTYLIGEEARNIAVVSLATDPDNFWDDEYGIHVVGTNGIDKYNIVANFNQDWERPISVELFETNGNREFQVDAGVKIFGQYSRLKAHKSLAFYMRSMYGQGKLNYRLFPDKEIYEFNNFLLRNAGNEWEETMYGDAISQYIIRDMTDVDYMAYRPAAVFLNGEYWGMLNLREKINEHYAASNYGIPADKVDMLENQGDSDSWIVSGSNSDYMALRTYMEGHSLDQQASFDHVASKVDVGQYTDYQITEIYENNTDWPGNNKKYFRNADDPESKWRWVLYDVDRGFSIRGQAPDYEKGGKDNLVRALTSGKWNFILPGLMANAAYREYFVKRFNAHINTTFHPERVGPMFDEWAGMLEPEMHRHIERWLDDRWDVSPLFDEKTIPGWYGIVDYKKYWATERPAVMMGILKEYFALGDTFRVHLSVNVPARGKVSVNGLVSPLSSFSGVWFEDYPLELKAIPEPGYQFVKWEGVPIGQDNAEYKLSLNQDRTVQAVFDAYDLVINELMADNKSTLADNAGEYDDWLEIHNQGSSPIDIGGMFLTDSIDNLVLWKIPETFPDSTTIEPGGFLVLWADAQPGQGILHLGFKLGDGGETIALTGSDSISIYSLVDFDRQYADRTWGSFPDGGMGREYMPASPGTGNVQFAKDWPIVINEAMAANNTTIADDFGEYDDWIELFNQGTQAVDVGGLFVTDNLGNPDKYRIPENVPEITTIEPGGFMLLWADDDDEQGPLHTNFKLSASGEELGLAEPGGKYFLDSLTFPLTQADLSYGRREDGTGLWAILDIPTPENSNKGVGIFIPDDPGILVYPNPFEDMVHIEPGALRGSEGRMLVYDLQGRLVYSEIFTEMNAVKLDLTMLSPGFYSLMIISEGEKSIHKLIKQK